VQAPLQALEREIISITISGGPVHPFLLNFERSHITGISGRTMVFVSSSDLSFPGRKISKETANAVDLNLLIFLLLFS
jgi:hypothetical protein